VHNRKQEKEGQNDEIDCNKGQKERRCEKNSGPERSIVAITRWQPNLSQKDSQSITDQFNTITAPSDYLLCKSSGWGVMREFIAKLPKYSKVLFRTVNIV
jgi:hypothetical protein